jgi:ABC-type amino acid transport substrate-binding protein
MRITAFVLVVCLVVASLARVAGAAPPPPPPKVLTPYTQEAPLVVGVSENAPYMIRRADGSWSGLAIEMWKLIADELHLTYTFSVVDDSKPFLDELSRFDVYPSLSIRLRNEEQRELTHPYVDESFAIAIRDERQSPLDVVRSLFSRRLLTAIGGLAIVLLLMGVLVWRIERKNVPDEFGGSSARGIVAGVIWTIEALAGKAKALSRTGSARAFNVFWALTCALLISGVTAKLSAEFTVSQLDARINGPEDLYRFRVGTAGSLTSEYLVSRGIRFTDFGANERDLVDALLSKKVDAIVYPASALKYYEKNVHPGRMRVVPATFHHFAFALALRPASPLLPHVNRALLKAAQSDAWKNVQVELVGTAN